VGAAAVARCDWGWLLRCDRLAYGRITSRTTVERDLSRWRRVVLLVFVHGRKDRPP
jgi:hypothetical protein